jgi:predicted membrane-bound spermidine synthase
VSGRLRALFALFFVSGFGGLIYEAVWTHYIKLFLGHAAYAQTLVLVVFIGGLAAGAWLVGRVAERVRNPLLAYAMVEGAIGLISLVFHPVFGAATEWGYAYLLPAACEPAQTWCWAQWLLAAGLLAPQSILLGATFPLVSSAVLRLDASRPGHHVASLYFLNSLGAVAGVLASAFVLVPALGLPGTLRAAGLANLALAAAAFALARGVPALLPAAATAPAAGDAASPRLVRMLLATAFLTGLSSFIYEIAWIRMLSLVLGASTHAFELMLASFILGLALGGAWVRHRIDRLGDAVRFLAMVQLAMGVAAALTIPVYNGTFDLMAWILRSLARNDGGFVLFGMSSTAIALLVMLPATFCAGMTLPLITERLMRSSEGERALGLVYAVNTLGSIVGVIVAVHLLLEWLGVRGALLVGAAVDVALGLALLALRRPRGAPLRLPLEAVAAVAFIAVIAAAFEIDPRRSSSGVFRTGAARLGGEETVIFHRDGKTATVDVVDSAGGLRSIRTNGKSDAAIAMREGAPPTSDEFTMALLGLLPLGHAPQAKTAAVIGFGSGMSTAVMLASPTLERVDTIEIEPAMVEGARHFRPRVEAAFSDPRSRIVIDDAKSYFARGRGRYDIIVSEPSNPWVSGVASLFTEEFYRRLSGYLAEGGVLSQWLHTYEMDAGTLASILGAVGRVFPDYALYSSIDTDLILVARKGGATGGFDASVLGAPALQPLLARLRLSEADLVTRRVVGRSGGFAAHFAAYGIPANSDYYPVVEHRSSRSRFTRERVADLIDLQAAPVPVLEMLAGAPPPPGRRTGGYLMTFGDQAAHDAWALHDALLGTPREVAPPAQPRELAAQVARAWADCRSGLAFEQALPSLVSVGAAVNPALAPAAARRVWQSLAASACGKRLAEGERRWLDLLEAIAARDAQRMVALSVAVLDAAPRARGPESETAIFAGVTGALCLGNANAARVLLENGKARWIRVEANAVLLRFLEAQLAAPPAASPSAYCPR